MAIPARFLDELRNRVGLADVVGRRTRLVKKGREYTGLCPFHKEKTPSFTVNEEKGFYHCFGCGAHGSAFDFVMETEGLSFREAVEKLAAEVGMQVPQDSPEERRRAERKKTLYDVVEAACQYFERQLAEANGAQALDYLRARGLSEATLKAFRLGFAPDSGDALKAALAAQGHSEAELLAAGLIVKRGDGSTYDRFRNRVMFPIADRRGRIVAFGGRILGDGEPKYLNSPETDLFHKGGLLYAMERAQSAVRSGAALVVTEGYMDVIALHQAGFEGAVAPLGTALTEDQIRELWKVAPEATLCFDGDNAGARAAARAAERALPLLRAGVGLRFATLPQGEDPDSLVQTRGAAAFAQLLAAAKPLSEVLWDMEIAAGTTDTPEGRAALQKRLDDHVRRIEDATVRGHFQSAFKGRVWALGRVYSPVGASAKRPGARAGGWGTALKTQVYDVESGRRAAKSSQVDLNATREEILIATLITHPELFDEVGEKLGTMVFSTVALDNLRQEALKTLALEGGLDTEALQRHLKDCGFSEILDQLLSPRVFGHAFFAQPTEPFETALAGWEETYELYCRRDLEAELKEAQRRLAADMSAENYERFRVLKMQEQAAQDRNAK